MQPCLNPKVTTINHPHRRSSPRPTTTIRTCRHGNNRRSSTGVQQSGAGSIVGATAIEINSPCQHPSACDFSSGAELFHTVFLSNPQKLQKRPLAQSSCTVKLKHLVIPWHGQKSGGATTFCSFFCIQEWPNFTIFHHNTTTAPCLVMYLYGKIQRIEGYSAISLLCIASKGWLCNSRTEVGLVGYGGAWSITIEKKGVKVAKSCVFP
ncbi:hypothetical protein V8F06_013824 [Rhypophila decipiens]